MSYGFDAIHDQGQIKNKQKPHKRTHQGNDAALERQSGSKKRVKSENEALAKAFKLAGFVVGKDGVIDLSGD